MTGLEKIIAEIENDAKEVARHNLEEANAKASAILEEGKKEIDSLKLEQEKVAKVRHDDIIERAKSSCELETRKAVLKKKQEIISKLIEDAKNEISNLPADKYFEVLLKLACTKASGENATMALNSADLERVPADFEKNLPEKITLSKTSVNIKNGFLLIYDGIDINCSFDALFEDKMEDLQDKSASILFS